MIGFAQNYWCGTQATQQQINYLTQTKSERQNWNKSKSIIWIPVQHHIVRESNGTGGLDITSLQSIMDTLNAYFIHADIQFFECESANFIDDSYYYNFDSWDEQYFCGPNDIANVVNVYYFNSMDGGFLYGKSNFPGGADRIIMDRYVADTAQSVVVHEFGHYFSLFHTFETFFGAELVNGSNCSWAGDQICDTEASIPLWGLVNSSCQYTGIDVDANGDPYNPDPRNFMGYSTPSCLNFMSAGQYNRANYSAINDRNYLGCDTIGCTDVLAINYNPIATINDSSCMYINDKTYIPDTAFEQALIDLGYDNVLDDSVLTGNINTITYLNVSWKDIVDLTGIEDFSSLLYLDCSGNDLSTLNFINNMYLRDLYCSYNQLLSLDVSNNLDLRHLDCSRNQLIILDVSPNINLSSLNCSSNQLTSLDLSTNSSLITLQCQSNQLTSLDVRNGNNHNFFNWNFYGPSFDATMNIQLYCIDVDNKAWSDSNWTIANGNINIWNNFSNDCQLEVYGCMDSLLPNYNPNATINDLISCNYGKTWIPDNNFEQALIDLGYDIDTIQNDSVPTAYIKYATQLYVGSQSIADLTGIEDFDSLQNLYCGTNQLTTLDLSQNTALTSLYCNDNQLTSLDLSNNTALTSLYCSNNILTSIDVRNGNNVNMYYPYFINNYNLYCIDVDNPSWSTSNWNNIDPWVTFSVSCQNEIYGCTDPLAPNYDPLATINNLSCNYGMTYIPDNNFEQALINLGCDPNPIQDDSVLTSRIQPIQNLNLNYSWISNLTGIEDFDDLQTLSCNGNQLTSLDLSNNTALTYLYCSYNQLTSINVSNLTNLWGVSCDNNYLTTLNLNNNIGLLNCSYNNITSLNLIPNNLVALDCSNNFINSLDLSSSIYLETLLCDSNQLTSLNVRNGNNHYFNNWWFWNPTGNGFDSRSNPLLSCIEVDDTTWSSNSWTNIDSQHYFSENCVIIPTWDCVNETCVDPGTGNGQYSSLAACQANCVSTLIISQGIEGINIYPNPTNGILNIEFSILNSQDIRLNLLNTIGEVIFTEGLSNHLGEYKRQINLQEYSKAIYFLEIQTNDGIVNKKLILQ